MLKRLLTHTPVPPSPSLPSLHPPSKKPIISYIPPSPPYPARFIILSFRKEIETSKILKVRKVVLKGGFSCLEGLGGGRRMEKGRNRVDNGFCWE